MIRAATSSSNRSRGVSSSSRTSGSISDRSRTDLGSNRVSAAETGGSRVRNDKSPRPNRAPAVAALRRKCLLEVGGFIKHLLFEKIPPGHEDTKKYQAI